MGCRSKHCRPLISDYIRCQSCAISQREVLYYVVSLCVPETFFSELSHALWLRFGRQKYWKLVVIATVCATSICSCFREILYLRRVTQRNLVARNQILKTGNFYFIEGYKKAKIVFAAWERIYEDEEI